MEGQHAVEGREILELDGLGEVRWIEDQRWAAVTVPANAPVRALSECSMRWREMGSERWNEVGKLEASQPWAMLGSRGPMQRPGQAIEIETCWSKGDGPPQLGRLLIQQEAQRLISSRTLAKMQSELARAPRMREEPAGEGSAGAPGERVAGIEDPEATARWLLAGSWQRLIEAAARLEEGLEHQPKATGPLGRLERQGQGANIRRELRAGRLVMQEGRAVPAPGRIPLGRTKRRSPDTATNRMAATELMLAEAERTWAAAELHLRATAIGELPHPAARAEARRLESLARNLDGLTGMELGEGLSMAAEAASRNRSKPWRRSARHRHDGAYIEARRAASEVLQAQSEVEGPGSRRAAEPTAWELYERWLALELHKLLGQLNWLPAWAEHSGEADNDGSMGPPQPGRWRYVKGSREVWLDVQVARRDPSSTAKLRPDLVLRSGKVALAIDAKLSDLGRDNGSMAAGTPQMLRNSASRYREALAAEGFRAAAALCHPGPSRYSIAPPPGEDGVVWAHPDEQASELKTIIRWLLESERES